MIYIIIYFILMNYSHSKKNYKKSNKSNYNNLIDKEYNEDDKYFKNIIIPTKKEKITTKAFRSIIMLNKNMKQSINYLKLQTNKIKRDIKSYISSDFEVLLLRLTSPDKIPPLIIDIKRFLATTQTFIRNNDLKSQSNTYRVTLRKLWSKIIETNINTKIKGIYLLHTLLKYSDIEDSIIYQKLINKMSKEYSKKTNCKYFDIIHIYKQYKQQKDQMNHNHLNDVSYYTINNEYLHYYSMYVVQRAKLFTSNFNELIMINYNSNNQDIIKNVSY